MTQKIQQANIFGRIGSGIGKGLAEQVPKEIERERLSSGLKNLGKNNDGLTPFQRFAELSSIPGITPQMIQSGGDLLRHEGIRNAYGNRNGQNNRSNEDLNKNSNQSSIRDIQFANMQKKSTSENKGDIPSGFANREEQSVSQPGIVKENPTQNKFIPAIPWNPQQKEADIAREWDRNPNLTFDQVQAKSNDNEARYLAAPEAYRAQYDYLQKREEAADLELDKQLATSLQKGGDQIYNDLTA